MRGAEGDEEGAAALPPPPEPPPAEQGKPAAQGLIPPSEASGSPAAEGLMPPSETSGSATSADLDQIRGVLNPIKWGIRFDDVWAAGRWRDGFLYVYYPSRWMVVRDLEGDILAGRYLDVDMEITEGMRLLIDVFEVCVVHSMQAEPIVHDQFEVVDLTAEPVPSKPRFRGRFWVLANEEDDDAEDGATVVHPEEKPRMRLVKSESAALL
ncbi:hypothetical protein VPH35_078314 [Triticum aestivum]